MLLWLSVLYACSLAMAGCVTMFSILMGQEHGETTTQEICSPEPSVGVMHRLELLVDSQYFPTIKLDMLLTWIFYSMCKEIEILPVF
jgi:hypothetical protein